MQNWTILTWSELRAKVDKDFLRKNSIWSDSVWLDLGGGMEPDDQGWEAIIQSLRHDPTLEQ